MARRLARRIISALRHPSRTLKHRVYFGFMTSSLLLMLYIWNTPVKNADGTRQSDGLNTRSTSTGTKSQADHVTRSRANKVNAYINRTRSAGHVRRSRVKVQPEIAAKNTNSTKTESKSERKEPAKSFGQLISRYVHPKTKTVLVSFGRSSDLDMAVNLYETSYKRFQTKYYLYVGLDAQFCQGLVGHAANCLPYTDLWKSTDLQSVNVSKYLTSVFIELKLLHVALENGINVVRVDLDVFFFKNPLWSVQCKNCDLAIQRDSLQDYRDTGLFLAVARKGSRLFFQRALAQISGVGPDSDLPDLDFLDQIVTEMTQLEELTVTVLDDVLYPNGKMFFQRGGRTFRDENPCRACVIVHNNGPTQSKEARRYRFKEYGLWAVDFNAYYSDTNRKYLQYDNPWTFKFQTQQQEGYALRTAFTFGYLLNRTVVLPAFHVAGRLKNLDSFLNISQLEAQLGEEAYREHVFFTNDMVPARTKNSITPPYLLQPQGYNLHPHKTVQVRNISSIFIKRQEVLKLFSGVNEYVLKFHSLYVKFTDDQLPKDLADKLDRAFGDIGKLPSS